MAKREAFLASGDVGSSSDTVQALIKKHEDFEKSLQAQVKYQRHTNKIRELILISVPLGGGGGGGALGQGWPWPLTSIGIGITSMSKLTSAIASPLCSPLTCIYTASNTSAA